MQDVPLYYTHASPFCYLAWHRITRHPERYPGIRFRWTPILFRRLMALQDGPSGGSPPLVLKYNYADAERWAHAYGIPFAHYERRVPADQTAHKVHLLAQDAGGTWEARWLKAIFTMGRVEGKDTTDGAAVRQLAESMAMPGLKALDAPELDARLEANTQQALRDEVCGVPFVRHAGQAYWGHDRLPWLESALLGKRPPLGL